MNTHQILLEVLIYNNHLCFILALISYTFNLDTKSPPKVTIFHLYCTVGQGLPHVYLLSPQTLAQGLYTLEIDQDVRYKEMNL